MSPKRGDEGCVVKSSHRDVKQAHAEASPRVQKEMKYLFDFFFLPPSSRLPFHPAHYQIYECFSWDRLRNVCQRFTWLARFWSGVKVWQSEPDMKRALSLTQRIEKDLLTCLNVLKMTNCSCPPCRILDLFSKWCTKCYRPIYSKSLMIIHVMITIANMESYWGINTVSCIHAMTKSLRSIKVDFSLNDACTCFSGHSPTSWNIARSQINMYSHS